MSAVETPTVLPPARASERPKKFTKLQGLGCWPELQRRMDLGQSIPQLTEWVVDVLKEWSGSRRAFACNLYEWRREHPTAALLGPVPTVANPVPTTFGTNVDRVNGKERLHQMQERVEVAMGRDLDEFEELGRLYRMQQERINDAIVTESEVGFLNPQVGVLMSGAMKILERRAILRRQLGGLKNQAEQVAAQHQLAAQQQLSGLGHVQSSPVSRGKIISLVRRLGKLQGELDDDELGESVEEAADSAEQ